MTSLGMWACQYRELRPIMFGGQKTQAQIDGTSEEREALVQGAGQDEDIEMGNMGGRRGRGRDAGLASVPPTLGDKSNQA